MNQTLQRTAILEELHSLNCHPTAEELYERLRLRLPSISLGTVYRNLEVLAAAGQVLKLDCAGRRKRFDGNVTPHNHRSCPGCGRLFDLPESDHHPELHRILQQLAARLGCDSYSVEFQGYCPACRPAVPTPAAGNAASIQPKEGIR